MGEPRVAADYCWDCGVAADEKQWGTFRIYGAGGNTATGEPGWDGESAGVFEFRTGESTKSVDGRRAMNQYLFLRRMRGPIMLLTFGITAILDEYTGIHYSRSWPLYIIVWGLMKLAENAILAQNPPDPTMQYPGYAAPAAGPGYTTYTGAPYAGTSPTGPVSTESSTAIVPVRDLPTHDEEGR
jgi:hypothetical protein